MPSSHVMLFRGTQAHQPEWAEPELLRFQGAALNATSDAMMITDRAGSIVWVNDAFTTLTGFTGQDAIGKNPKELIRSGFYDQPFYRHLWATILSGRTWRGEMTNRRKDGSFYHEDQTITPVKNLDGDITHFVAIKRDLALERQLEAQVVQVQKVEVVGNVTATEVSKPADATCLTIVGLETILVVEDHETLRNLTTRVLRSAGYRVLAAARGTDALTLLEYHRGRLDLLITDVVLPDTTGSGLAQRLIEDRPEIQVLYASGYIDDDLPSEGRSEHSAHFIRAPYTESSLTRKVREVLDLQRRPQVA